jgi:hypothetical protein
VNTSHKMRNNGTLIVLLHIAALLGHASSHVHLTIGVDTWQSAFIVIVIFAAPLFAMILLWMRFYTAGVYLLGISMAGSLIFGVYYHFVVAGADNAFGMGPGTWSTAFRITAGLLAAIEAVGCAWCVWILGLQNRNAAVQTRL